MGWEKAFHTGEILNAALQKVEVVVNCSKDSFTTQDDRNEHF